MGKSANLPRMIVPNFAVTDKVQTLALATVFPGAERVDGPTEERGFLGLLHRSAGSPGHSLLLAALVPQEPGWVVSGYDGLTFSHRYFSRGLDIASKDGQATGLMVVHSHYGPRGEVPLPPSPSHADLRAEREQLYFLSQALGRGAPVAAGILAPSGGWRVREYAWPRPSTPRQAKSRRYRPSGGTCVDIERIKVVGSGRVRLQVRSETPPVSNSALESTLRLWGEGGQRILSQLRIGVVGVGGVGSIVVEYLARLGVGELVLVDFDCLEPANLNRAIGARRRDVGRPKVEYVSRLARESSLLRNFRVEAYRESAAEWSGFRHLLNCDIIVSSADSASSRQVLDHAAYAHLLPVVDGGTVFIVDAATGKISGKSQVSEAGPGRPCLECQGVYSREEATLARESVAMQAPNPYVLGPDGRATDLPRAPSVVSHNGLVASLIVQRVLRLALGTPPDKGVGQQRFYVEEGEVHWTRVDACDGACPKGSWVALGDSHAAPVGIDPIWKCLREREEAAP